MPNAVRCFGLVALALAGCGATRAAPGAAVPDGSGHVVDGQNADGRGVDTPRLDGPWPDTSTVDVVADLPPSDPDLPPGCGPDSGVSTCQPELLVPGTVMSLGYDDRNVHFDPTEGFYGQLASGGVGRVSLDGSTTSVLSTQPLMAAATVHITGNAKFVYFWTGYANGPICVVPKNGGAATLISVPVGTVWDMAADDTALYWAGNDCSSGSTAVVGRVPVGSSTTQVMLTCGQMSGGHPRMLLEPGSLFLLYAEGQQPWSALYRLPTAGGALVALDPQFAAPSDRNSYMSGDTSVIYGGSVSPYGNNGAISVYDRATGKTSKHGASLACATGGAPYCQVKYLAADATGLYFTDGSSVLRRFNKSSKTIETVFDGGGQVGQVFVDAASVYFVWTGGNGSGYGWPAYGIYRLPKCCRP